MKRTKLQGRLERFSADEFAPITTKALARIVAEKLCDGERAEEVAGEMGVGRHYLYTITSSDAFVYAHAMHVHCTNSLTN